MAVIDMVINGLEHCKRTDGEKCPDCPYFHTECTASLSADALELLKEQQQKKGHWQPYKYGDDTWHQCSACGVADRYIDIVRRDGYPDYRMVSKRNFCPNCGADMRENETH